MEAPATLQLDGEAREIHDRSATGFTVTAPLGTGAHELVVDSPSGQSNSLQLVVEEAKLIPLLSGSTFKLNKATLSPKGAKTIRKRRARLLRQVDRIKQVRIGGHTDYKGTAADNLKLSKGRAETVRKELLRGLKLPSKSIIVKAYGEKLAVAKKPSDPRRKKDRRVDVVVVYRR